MKTIITNNEAQTRALGISLGGKCQGGEFFCLSGDLGAGKTALSKGIAEGLGVKKNITSPTFIISNIYKIKNNKNIKTLTHIDAYRLQNTRDLENIGFFDLIKDKTNVTVVEWGEKIKKYLPKRHTKVEIKSLSENERKIIIS